VRYTGGDLPGSTVRQIRRVVRLPLGKEADEEEEDEKTKADEEDETAFVSSDDEDEDAPPRSKKTQMAPRAEESEAYTLDEEDVPPSSEAKPKNLKPLASSAPRAEESDASYTSD
jgi:hypothetical protein